MNKIIKIIKNLYNPEDPFEAIVSMYWYVLNIMVIGGIIGYILQRFWE
jgi:hypothetical protein